jgi:hypothetical protein
MRKYPARASPKVLAVIFGLMSLAGLVLWPILVYQWRDSVRSEAQYKIAPPCIGAEQSGCRRELESVVKGTHTGYGRNRTTHYVSLSLPDSQLNGNIPIWWETEHSLYGLLKPGDRVTAEEWEGQIAAIRSAQGSTLRTEYDPTHRREGFIIALIMIPLTTIFIIFIEHKLIRSIRKGP